jgi:hypothetical protein
MLLAVFLPVLTPAEFIHDLFGHEDTHDIFQPISTIDKAHRHCQVLQITFSSFISDSNDVPVENEYYHFDWSIADPGFIPGISVNLAFLRAPPAFQS